MVHPGILAYCRLLFSLALCGACLLSATTIYAEQATVNPVSVPFRMNVGNAGGQDYNLDGDIFQPEVLDYLVETQSTTVSTSSYSPNPGNTDLYFPRRFGMDFGYTIPVNNGDYVVVLHMVENFFTGGGSRVFDVLMEEEIVLDDKDLAADEGKGTLFLLQELVTVSDGTLDIQWLASENNGIVQALEILPAPGNTAPEAVAAANPELGVAPLDVNFDATASTDLQDNIAAYTWDFADGSAAGSGATTMHTFVMPGTYDVTLTVTDSEGLSDVANVTITVDDPNALPIRVNFSDQGTPAPPNYLKDFGEGFGDRGTYNYGWVVPGTTTLLDLVGNGRNRTPNPDEDALIETLMHMQYDDVSGNNGVNAEGAWEIELPNGMYEVTIGAGDQGNENTNGTTYSVNVEDVNLIDEVATQGTSNFYTATQTVTLSDGRLTIDAAGGFNTKINYVIIIPVPGTINDADIVASDTEFLFETTVNTDGNQTDAQTLTVTNEGTTDLTISSVGFTGTFADQFSVSGPANTVIAPGGTQDYTITFEPDLDLTNLGYQDAQFVIDNNSLNNPSLTVDLYALKKEGFEGTEEPPLQAVAEVLGIPVDIGWTTLINDNTTSDTPEGEEVIAQLFEAAGPGPVTLVPVARYSQAEPLPFGWYTNDNNTPMLNEVGILADGLPAAQTLNPTLQSGATSFDPQGAFFGIYVNSALNQITYTEDALNTATAHAVRVYPAKDRSGQLVPDSYLLAFEEATNGDYQDYVFVISNVQPYEADPQPVAAIRINAGGTAAYTDAQGQVWGLDDAFLTGMSETNSKNFDVIGTTEDDLFLEYRFAQNTPGSPGPNWGYDIPVQGTGPFTVNLYFLEIFFDMPGERQFDVFIEGNNVLNNYDLLAQANPETLITETFTDIIVSDGVLSIEFNSDINNSIISAVEIIGAGGTFQPFFNEVDPADGATGVSLTGVQVVASVNVPADYELDEGTIAGNVKLYKQTNNGQEEVPSNSNDTGGGDAVILTPSTALEPSTTYVFEIDGVQANRIGDLTDRLDFRTFTSTFTTESDVIDPDPPADLTGVSFTQVSGAELGQGVADRFSSLEIGPDGKLYAAATTGEVIKRWDIAADGTLTNLEELNLNLQGSNHPVTGTPASNDRIVIGFAFAPEATANNLVAYVTHSALTLSDGPEWDGKLTRISGPTLQTTEDILEHLPRSKKDHLTNSVVVGPDNNLYIVQGSNSAGGDPDPVWDNRPERLLSAAVLKVDLNLLPAQLPLSVYTTDDISVINAAPSNSILMSNGTYNPYAVNSPVTLYATGVRNAYDLVFHTNGWLYVPTNGTAGNNNNSPNVPASADYVSQDAAGVRRPDGSFITDTSIPGVMGGETQKDWLFKSQGGSYHGHPNPYRGEFILNHGGIAYSGLPGQESEPYTDVAKYPDNLGPDPNYLEIAYDFGKNKSPNGALEYRSNAFGGKLKGMLMVVRFSGQDDIIVLQPGSNSGDILQAFPDVPGLQNLDDPLDIIEDPNTGNVYVAQYDRGGNTQQQLILLQADQPASPEAVLTVQPNELIFETTVNTEGDQTDTKTLAIQNDGSVNLVVSSVALSGPFADQFSFNGPTSVTLAPGENQVYSVTYEPDLNNNMLGYQEAALDFQSNAEGGTLSFGLHALKKAGYEGGQEPPLQDVVNTLGIGINVGWTSLGNTTSPTLQGEEVDVPLFEKAGPGPVGILPVGRYSPAEELPFGWYTNVSNTVTLNEVGVLASGIDEAQTLFPALQSGGTSFDPSDAFFGIYVASSNQTSYTEDELNNNNFHRTRIYPIRDRDGNPVAGQYLVCFEEASNGDYQDFVYVLSNVQPYEPGALVLSFAPASLNVSVNRGAVSDPVSSTLSANGALSGNDVTITANESWVNVPDGGTVVVGGLNDFTVDATGLDVGIYEATVTASAPGYGPATLLLTVTVTAPSYPDWTTVGNGNFPRSEAQMVVYEGEYYFINGFSPGIDIENSVEKYNPITNTWTLLAQIPTNPDGSTNSVTHNGVALVGDNIWVVGGRVGDNPGPVTDKVWIYDISDDSWSPGPSLPLKRGSGGLARLGNKLHYVGGFDENAFCDVDIHLVYDLDEPGLGWQDWTATSPMPEPRNHFGTVVMGGKLYTVGGQNGHDGSGCGNAANNQFVHVYDPITDSWTRLADIPEKKSHIEPCTFAQDGLIYVVGGQNQGDKVWRYDPEADTWTELIDMKLPEKLLAPGARLWEQYMLVMMGGAPGTSSPVSTTRLKDFPRAPEFELGFNPSTLTVDMEANEETVIETLLFSLAGEAGTTYTIPTDNLPAWLSINNTTGLAREAFAEIELTFNTTGLSGGTYETTLTATAPGYQAATMQISLNVSASSNSLLGTLQLQGRDNYETTATVSFYEAGTNQLVEEFTDVSVDQTGMFTLPNVPIGTYDVYVKSLSYLANQQTITTVAGANTADFGTLSAGDADQDNQVTLLDFSLLAAAFNQDQDAPNYNVNADFNSDGSVNILDFSILAGNFLQSGAMPPQ